jgi:hypothetical protein
VVNERTTAYPVSGTNLRFPVRMNDKLDITLPFLTIQIFHKASDPINISLHIQNATRTVFKFNCTTHERKNLNGAGRSSTAVPLGSIPADIWVNLCFDLRYLVSTYSPGAEFESLQRIEIGSTCLIHWLFASSFGLQPEASGRDLPNKFKYTGGLESTTVLVGEGVPARASRKSRIPVRPQEMKRRPGTGLSHSKAKEKKLKQCRSERVTPTVFNDDPVAPIVIDDDFDNESEDELLKIVEVDVNAVSIKRKVGDDDEEELELVLIDGLGCYYCPANQQYYQIDE